MEIAQIKSIESLDKDNDMERGLKNRHVQFIAIGGRNWPSGNCFRPSRLPLMPANRSA